MMTVRDLINTCIYDNLKFEVYLWYGEQYGKYTKYTYCNAQMPKDFFGEHIVNGWQLEKKVLKIYL